MEISIHTKPNFLSVQLAGEFNHEFAQRFFNDILWDCKLTTRSRVLIDFRKITGDIPATLRVMTGLAGIKDYRTCFDSDIVNFKLAIVEKEGILEGQHLPDTATADILRDAGIDVMLTRAYSKAQDWIDQ